MNSLQYAGQSKAGNSLFWFPHHGHLFTFEKFAPRKIRLYSVALVDESVDRQWSEETGLLDLPNPVRAAIVDSPYRFKAEVSTAVEAM